MDKNSIIKMVQGSCPNIDNLSDRTWEEIAESLECIIFRDENMKEAIIKVFKTVSGQIRHDVSDQLRKALEKHEETQELNN